jgi:hypothetical protein
MCFVREKWLDKVFLYGIIVERKWFMNKGSFYEKNACSRAFAPGVDYMGICFSRAENGGERTADGGDCATKRNCDTFSVSYGFCF